MLSQCILCTIFENSKQLFSYFSKDFAISKVRTKIKLPILEKFASISTHILQDSGNVQNMEHWSIKDVCYRQSFKSQQACDIFIGIYMNFIFLVI